MEDYERRAMRDAGRGHLLPDSGIQVSMDVPYELLAERRRTEIQDCDPGDCTAHDAAERDDHFRYGDHAADDVG